MLEGELASVGHCGSFSVGVMQFGRGEKAVREVWKELPKLKPDPVPRGPLRPSKYGEKNLEKNITPLQTERN